MLTRPPAAFTAARNEVTLSLKTGAKSSTDLLPGNFSTQSAPLNSLVGRAAGGCATAAVSGVRTLRSCAPVVTQDCMSVEQARAKPLSKRAVPRLVFPVAPGTIIVAIIHS